MLASQYAARHGAARFARPPGMHRLEMQGFGQPRRVEIRVTHAK
jgi:hypothetical protein